MSNMSAKATGNHFADTTVIDLASGSPMLEYFRGTFAAMNQTYHRYLQHHLSGLIHENMQLRGRMEGVRHSVAFLQERHTQALAELERVRAENERLRTALANQSPVPTATFFERPRGHSIRT